MTTKTFTVRGMTCGHCVNHVTTEISKVAGVVRVDVALESGEVTVESSSAISDVDVQTAVVAAGYEFVG